MKRIIAAALAILLGSTGYVIVDHTLEDRVEALESQVSSLQDDASSLNEKISVLNDATFSTESTNKSYNTGDKIPLSKSQKFEFNIHYLKTKHWDYDTISEEFYDPDYNPYHESNGQIIDEKDYKVNLTDLSFTVASSDIKEHISTGQYTTSSCKYCEIGISVKCHGTTSTELSGKTIKFDLIYDTGRAPFFPTTTKKISDDNSVQINQYSTIINEDGTFDLDVTYIYNAMPLNNVFNECYLVNPQIK